MHTRSFIDILIDLDCTKKSIPRENDLLGKIPIEVVQQITSFVIVHDSDIYLLFGFKIDDPKRTPYLLFNAIENLGGYLDLPLNLYYYKGAQTPYIDQIKLRFLWLKNGVDSQWFRTPKISTLRSLTMSEYKENKVHSLLQLLPTEMTEIILKRHECTVETLKLLNRFQSLRSFGCSIMTVLTSHAKLPESVKQLVLFDASSTGTTDVLKSIIEYNGSLTSLYLDSYKYYSLNIPFSLKELTLITNKEGSYDYGREEVNCIEEINSLAKIQTLKKLTIVQQYVNIGDICCLKYSNLKSLSLNSTGKRANKVVVLHETTAKTLLSSFPHLTELSIKYCGITEEALNVLLHSLHLITFGYGSRLPEITDFYQDDQTDAYFTQFTNLKYFKYDTDTFSYIFRPSILLNK
jgi:hypothetical protein